MEVSHPGDNREDGTRPPSHPLLEADHDKNYNTKGPMAGGFSLLLELLLCVVSLCFIVLASLAVWMKDRPTGDKLGSRMEEVMRLGPTIYPIIFASLLSRSLKHIGRYMAQKGVRLGTLWSVMNSNSVSDPITHVFSNPATIVAWVLLPIWALSPLGGQGSLRLMAHANLTTTSVQELRYLDTGPLANAFTYLGIWEANDGGYPYSMRDTYFATVMQPVSTKGGPIDQWQNVKIPRIDALSNIEADAQGWIPTHNLTGPQMYSSLLGVPIVNFSVVKQQGTVGFSLETSYVELSCPSVQFSDGEWEKNPGLNITCPNCGQWGQTPRCNGLLGPPVPPMTPDDQVKYGPPQIQFTSQDQAGVTRATCTATQRMVEAMVRCTNGDCAAILIRPSATDHRSQAFTSFDCWSSIVLAMISQGSRSPADNSVMQGVSTTELFLKDPTALPVQTEQVMYRGQAVNSNFSQVAPGDFAARASILLNTGIQIFMAPTGFAGNLPTNNMTIYGPGHLPADGLLSVANRSAWSEASVSFPPPIVGDFVTEDPPFLGASTNATLLRYKEVYKPNYVWIVLLMISSAMLLVSGVTGIFLRSMTAAPNIFDPVISLTYTNPFLSLPARPAPLEANDRLMVLSKKKVKLAYADHGDNGRTVAFGDSGSF